MSLDTKSASVKFTIKDNGIGIPKHLVTNIFKAYHQGEKDTFKKYGGTGLGLFVVQNIL